MNQTKSQANKCMIENTKSKNTIQVRLAAPKWVTESRSRNRGKGNRRRGRKGNDYYSLAVSPPPPTPRHDFKTKLS